MKKGGSSQTRLAMLPIFLDELNSYIKDSKKVVPKISINKKIQTVNKILDYLNEMIYEKNRELYNIFNESLKDLQEQGSNIDDIIDYLFDFLKELDRISISKDARMQVIKEKVIKLDDSVAKVIPDDVLENLKEQVKKFCLLDNCDEGQIQVSALDYGQNAGGKRRTYGKKNTHKKKKTMKGSKNKKSKMIKKTKNCKKRTKNNKNIRKTK